MNERDVLGILSGVWCMHREHFDRLAARLRAVPELPTGQQLASYREQKMASKGKASGGIGYLDVTGPLEQWPSYLSWYGGSSYEVIGAELSYLLRDPGISAIVAHVDSPGGSSYGCMELADKIYEGRKQKPIHAVVNSLAASAAYWLTSQCSTISLTPGGDVGSVGVYALHVDMSQALAEDGVKVTMVRAGKYKAEMSPYEPLTADAKDYLQEQVSRTYKTFVDSVARGRGKSPAAVAAGFGMGRLVDATRAKALSMVDHVEVASAALARLAGGVSSAGGGVHANGRQAAAPKSLDRLRREQQARRRELEHARMDAWMDAYRQRKGMRP